MQVIFYLFILPVAILFLTGPVAVFIFMSLLERGHGRGLGIFWLGLGFIAVCLGIFISYTFSDFFPGPGCFISGLTPVAAIITFLIFRLRARRGNAAHAGDGAWRRWLLAGSLLIPALQLSALVISFGYGQTCVALNQLAAQPIIGALEKYQAETGHYLPLDKMGNPSQSDLKFLVPNYLASIPARACVVPFFNSPNPYNPVASDWSLLYCGNNSAKEVLLMVPILGSDSQQIYNLSTGHWWRGNALDGYCGYLR